MIIEVGADAMVVACAQVLRQAFRTVMDDRCLGEADVPTNAAFMTVDRLRAAWLGGTRLFAVLVAGHPVGCVALRPGSRPGDDQVMSLEWLAVLPDHRHQGYGAALVAHATAVAAAEGATAVRIAIIDDNTVLKRWYQAAGFIERGCRDFAHLPFTVCYLDP